MITIITIIITTIITIIPSPPSSPSISPLSLRHHRPTVWVLLRPLPQGQGRPG
jgi:hypothetical protein